MGQYKRIGLMTSGGDVPGLNAAIRAVVRACQYYGIEVMGVQRGYEGLIDGDIIHMGPGSVSHIINRGGTILRSSRSERFTTPEGRQQAYQQMKQAGMEALILIGGDGSMRGAQRVADESGIPVIGIPKTIDNDLTGTDKAIGFDTAVNVAMEAIDKVRDTALSHNRLFFVEVMGRKAGYIAMEAGMATGAEAIIIPETDRDLDMLWRNLEQKKNWAYSSYIVVVAEGDESGGAYKLADYVRNKYPHIHSGVVVLGHIQRGGSPTCADRNLATRLGIEAVHALQSGWKNIMVGIVKGDFVYTPLHQVQNRSLELDDDAFEIMSILSR
jgi:6-phosphofructokinase 1